jgi:T-complex protein 1 subunit theta
MILTSDAATILRELEVVHPAAKLLVMASQQQDAEMGDGTNLVIVLAGELLKKAEELLRLGLKTSDIVQGYEKAQNFALKVLEGGLPLFRGVGTGHFFPNFLYLTEHV